MSFEKVQDLVLFGVLAVIRRKDLAELYEFRFAPQLHCMMHIWRGDIPNLHACQHARCVGRLCKYGFRTRAALQLLGGFRDRTRKQAACVATMLGSLPTASISSQNSFVRTGCFKLQHQARGPGLGGRAQGLESGSSCRSLVLKRNPFMKDCSRKDEDRGTACFAYMSYPKNRLVLMGFTAYPLKCSLKPRTAHQ